MIKSIKKLNKFIKQNLPALLSYCFIVLLSQNACCYTLTGSQLNAIIVNKIASEIKKELGDLEYKIDIQNEIPDSITTNDSKPPIILISSSNGYSPLSYRRVTIKDSNENTVKIFPINVHIALYKNVLVASENISFGKNIDTTNSKIEKRDVSKFYDKTLTELPINYVSSRNIMKDSIILTSSVKKRAVIQKNQSVDIVFQGKGIQIAQ